MSERQHFALIPVDAARLIQQLCPSALPTYVALRSFHDPKRPERCWPSQRAIGERTGIPIRTVRSHLQALEASGLIERKHRTKRKGEGRGRTADRYVFPNAPQKPRSTGNTLPLEQADLPARSHTTNRQDGVRPTGRPLPGSTLKLTRKSTTEHTTTSRAREGLTAETIAREHGLDGEAVEGFVKMIEHGKGKATAALKKTLPTLVSEHGPHLVSEVLRGIAHDPGAKAPMSCLPGRLKAIAEGKWRVEHRGGFFGGPECHCRDCEAERQEGRRREEEQRIEVQARIVVHTVAEAEARYTCPACSSAFLAMLSTLPREKMPALMSAAAAGDEPFKAAMAELVPGMGELIQRQEQAMGERLRALAGRRRRGFSQAPAVPQKTAQELQAEEAKERRRQEEAGKAAGEKKRSDYEARQKIMRERAAWELVDSDMKRRWRMLTPEQQEAFNGRDPDGWGWRLLTELEPTAVLAEAQRVAGDAAPGEKL